MKITSNRKAFYLEPNSLECVSQLLNLFEFPIGHAPKLVSEERSKLRVSLLKDSLQKFEDSIQERNLVTAADAMVGMQYNLSGTVLEFGMGAIFMSLFDEVHRSNMTKAPDTLSEAEETRRYYAYHKNIRSHIRNVGKKWLVFSQSDSKVLESVKHSPANLAPILKLAQEKEMSSSLVLLASPAALSSVSDFHQTFLYPVLESPTLPSTERCQHRLSLLKREIEYFEAAISNKNLVEVADTLTNLQYVLSGSVLEFGMGRRFFSLFDEVHQRKMFKACKTPEEEENYKEKEETEEDYEEAKFTDSYVEQLETETWLEYSADKKARNTMRYSPANLGDLLRLSEERELVYY